MYLLLERYEEALADYSRAIELNPGDGWAIGGRGLTYRMLERYEEALADLGRAIELDPSPDVDVADSFLSIAANNLQKGNRETVARVFEAIIAASPDDVNARNGYAFFLLPADPAAALAELEEARSLQGESLTMLANEVLALHLLGRNAEAVALGTSESALTLPSSNELMWMSDGNHVLRISDLIDVREYLQSLLDHITSDSAEKATGS